MIPYFPLSDASGFIIGLIWYLPKQTVLKLKWLWLVCTLADLIVARSQFKLSLSCSRSVYIIIVLAMEEKIVIVRILFLLRYFIERTLFDFL